LNYFFIIGERSGDLHASNLIKAIKQQDADAVVEGVGGELSEASGMSLTYHYEDLAIMGFIKVLFHLGTIKKNFKRCQEAILASKPDAVVLVDFPGFNLRMAKGAKENDFKVFYYIAPKVWASRSKRVHKIKAFTDKVYTIFPFENDFFKAHDVDYEYVGNPLLDSLAARPLQEEGKADFHRRHQLSNKPIIALLAGSRKQEVKKLLPLFLDVREHFPKHQFILAGVDNLGEDFYTHVCPQGLPLIIYNETYAILQHAEAALVASGTATLETALLRIPQVVCYNIGGGRFVYRLYECLMVKVKFISLVNLIMDKMVVKELLQHHFNADNLVSELKLILNVKGYRQQMLSNYDIISDKLGGEGASFKTAQSIIKQLTNAKKQITPVNKS
jgi:lipid-A-disaccharide synthase